MIAFYELNKEYITEMFCVNKSKPTLACEGKCFLRNQLAQIDSTQKQYPAKMMDVKDIHLFPIYDHGPVKFLELIKKAVPWFLDSFFSGNYIHEVFHPPK